MTETVTAPRRVTFALMAYRQEALVRAAIEGAFAQIGAPLEIILSDDASPDGTFAVMEAMAAAYRGPHAVRLNRNPVNMGILGHVNRLFALASGDFVVIAAGDDVSEPDRAARLAAAWTAGRGRVFAVHSSTREIDGAGRPGPLRPPPAAVATPASSPSPLLIAREMANCIGATAAWDRAVFDRFGPLPETREAVEDGHLFFRAALLGDIAYLDAPLVRWRTDGLSGDSGLSPGRDYLQGNRIKFRKWVLANMQSWTRDLETAQAQGLACPEADEILRICRWRTRRFGYDVALARRPPLGRIAFLPIAAAISLRHRRNYHLREAWRQALGPLWAWWHDRGAVQR